MGVVTAPRLSARIHLAAAGAQAVVATVVYAVFSVTRHMRFGSGSWDMGCHVHNLFLLGFAQPPVSSVLGDANFWGGTNHFMPSIALAAPLAWTGWTWSLLVLQAIVVAAAVVPLAWIAAGRGVGPLASAAIGFAYLSAVGTQTFINFDVHETAPVPLLTFLAIAGFELEDQRRGRAIAWLSLIVLAGTKESAILYAAAVGLWLCAFKPGRRVEGAAIFGALVAWFFIVTAVLQPAFLEPGAHMVHVARFKQLGADPVEVAKNIVFHPLHTVGLLFAPAPKAQTLAVTMGGFAFLPLLSPPSLLLAAPNLAERFLSDKREMWGLGFHYSLVLVGACAYGAVDAVARVKARVKAWLAGSPLRAVRFDVAAGIAILAGALGSQIAAPFPPELSSLQKPYMASVDDVERYQRALALIPTDAKVVAQNHFLPHLAFRRFIWQPEERFVQRADWVILDARASPWPHTTAYVSGLVARLRADPAFRIAFEEASTIVFERRSSPPKANDPP